MVPKQSYPPTHHHPTLTKPLPPAIAQEKLSKFLVRTQSNAYLHPDSLSSNAGITYSAHSGPSGGLAIHHLKRIEAGLRGENLIAESAEDLDELFGRERKGSGLRESDEKSLDGLTDHPARSRKRTRGVEEIEEWAESSSKAAAEAERDSLAGDPVALGDWQDQQEYAEQQRPMQGEVGEREQAPVVRQNGALPGIVEHDEDGEVKTVKEKAARKEAKKARKVKERQKMAKAAG